MQCLCTTVMKTIHLSCELLGFAGDFSWKRLVTSEEVEIFSEPAAVDLNYSVPALYLTTGIWLHKSSPFTIPVLHLKRQNVSHVDHKIMSGIKE